MGCAFLVQGPVMGLLPPRKQGAGHSRSPPGKGQLPRWTGHLLPGARREDFTLKQRMEANLDWPASSEVGESQLLG